MSKRACCLALLALTVALTAFLARASVGRSRLSAHYAGGKTLDEIAGARRQTEESILTGVVFNGQNLILDMVENRLYYSLVEGDPDARDPYVRFTSQLDGVQIAVEEKPIDDALIESAGEIRLVAYTDEEYSEYRLSVTTLPVMNVFCDETLIPYQEGDIPMRMELFDNRRSALQRLIRSDGLIHIRGRASYYFPKKSYKLTLQAASVGESVRENDVSLLGMRQDGDWILYGIYSDPQKVRNAFSSRLWDEGCAENNSLGFHFGMRYEYVELFRDSRYWGLYALGFPIDAKQAALAPGESLYGFSRAWRHPSYDMKEHYADILEFSPYDAGRSPDYEPILRYAALVCDPQAAKEDVLSVADLDNMIDIFLFSNLVQGRDNAKTDYINNVKFAYKHTDGGYRLFIAPWDLDLTFGNTFTGDVADSLGAKFTLTPEDYAVMNLNPAYWLVCSGDAQTKARMARRYAQLRAGAWSDERIREILGEYERSVFFSGAFARDASRWPRSAHMDLKGNSPHPLSTFTDYVIDHAAVIDAYVDALTR